ncbi:MAG: SurA N-terminal domain-containing protein [Bacteroidales bacterium]|nr:SurA N-terminal domain-containing protein [Bacteroidales bacterium]
MAVLEKLRVKFGMAVSIIIALGLLSFIIDPNEVISAFQGMSSKYDVGEINGKSVSYNNFQEDVQKFTTINEFMTGNTAHSAEQQMQIRNAAWQDLIYKYLFVEKAREAGLNVGSAEMLDLTTGDMISPLIAQNPAFMDNNGNFSKENLVNLVNNLDSDQTGNLRLYWNYLQSSIFNQEIFSKYNSLFTQSSVLSPMMLRRTIAENNNTTDVEFVMVPFGYQRDSSITVSDSEIKNYYNSHKKFYKQNASRDIEYVVFEVKPSAKDISAENEKVAALWDEFATADNMKSFLMKNSDRPYDERYYKAGELKTVSADVDDFVWKGDAPVSEVIAKGNDFYVARVMDTKMIPDSVYVRHILLTGDDAQHKADSLKDVLSKGGSFSNLAALYSDDQNSAADGEKGNIGWMTQNYMIPGFESVLTAEKGKPFVLKTQYGTHVVEVSKSTLPVLKKKVAILYKETIASKETFNIEYAKANQFATAAAGSYENYRKAVDTLGVYSHPVNNLAEGTDRLGAIENAREVTRWAFENKAGKVSNIISVDNNYFFIATVRGVHKEGYAKVQEVASAIRENLYYEKLAAKKSAEVAEKINGLTDLQAVADKLGTTVSSQSGVAFSSMNSQGLDPKFIGAASVAPENTVCGPVAGSIGIYVFKVTGRDTGSFYTEDDAKTRSSQMNSYLSQMIVPVMMDDADVKDNRARFF